MALEAVVYQQQDLFGDNYNNNGIDNPYPFLLETWSSSTGSDFIPFPDEIDDDHHHDRHDQINALSYDYLLENQPEFADWHQYYNYETNTSTNNNSNNNSNDNICCGENEGNQWGFDTPPNEKGDVVLRPKRRRARSKKNKEDIENQRMTHIAVERNRRKQMNEYLSVLRSLMPESYVQRGDQASIVGGAINFVKELEQNLQCLSVQKQVKQNHGNGGATSSLPFGEFFTFPQYTTTGGDGGWKPTWADDDNEHEMMAKGGATSSSHGLGGGAAVADVEVTMVESHAHLKIRSKRRPKQLLKIVSGLRDLRLAILHLNVTTVDGVVLYSFSLKVEDETKLSSVEEVARVVYELLSRIEDETNIFNC